MKRIAGLVFAGALGLASIAALAQTTLPGVTVTEHAQDVHHGGYVISSDFQVDAHMSSVIFPTEPLHEGDILSVQPLRLADDEYFVLQECVVADCTTARIWRVWGAFGATTSVHDPNRMFIPHDGKYFMFMKKIRAGAAPSERDYSTPLGTQPTASPWFTQFEVYGPPLTLKPVGVLAANSRLQIEEAEKTGVMPIKASEREEASFLATFETGTKVRLKRMHAE